MCNISPPNLSGIRPCEYNVLVKPYVVEAKTSGGSYLPEDVQKKDENAQTKGIVVAMSPMAFANPDWPDAKASSKPMVGEIIMYARYAGASSKITGKDGVEYILIKDQDITAVYEE